MTMSAFTDRAHAVLGWIGVAADGPGAYGDVALPGVAPNAAPAAAVPA